MTVLTIGRVGSLPLALAALAGAGALAALAVIAVPGLGHSLYPDAPRPALSGGAVATLELLAHNAPVALWPLALVLLGWHGIPVARRVGDGLIAAQLAIHGATIGAALATWPELARWLPHLPAEYAAIALPCAVWIAARRNGCPTPSQLALLASATLALLAFAASLETWGTPS